MFGHHASVWKRPRRSTGGIRVANWVLRKIRRWRFGDPGTLALERFDSSNVSQGLFDTTRELRRVWRRLHHFLPRRRRYGTLITTGLRVLTTALLASLSVYCGRKPLDRGHACATRTAFERRYAAGERRDGDGGGGGGESGGGRDAERDSESTCVDGHVWLRPDFYRLYFGHGTDCRCGRRSASSDPRLGSVAITVSEYRVAFCWPRRPKCCSPNYRSSSECARFTNEVSESRIWNWTTKDLDELGRDRRKTSRRVTGYMGGDLLEADGIAPDLLETGGAIHAWRRASSRPIDWMFTERDWTAMGRRFARADTATASGTPNRARHSVTARRPW